MTHDSLFEPVKMGTQTLKNRILMAPLTRLRSVEPGDVPTALAGENMRLCLANRRRYILLTQYY